MPLHAEVDKDACLSSGRCVADHPDAFGFDDDELAEVLPTVTRLSDDQLRDAAEQCPAEAIILRDAEGRTVFPA